MKSLLRLGLVALGLLLAQFALPSLASAADCVTGYARTPGTWATSGTFYNASPGGVACTLTAGDAAVFDANTNTGTYNLGAAISLVSLDASAAPAGVIMTQTNGQALTITGTKFALSSAMTYTLAATNLISFTPGAGVTVAITTGGHQLQSVTCNGANGTTSVCQQVDALSVLNTLTLTQGVWDDSTNNQTVTAGVFSSSNANTRTLNCGTATWTVNNATATLWDFTTSTGLTVNCSNMIQIAGTPTANRAFIIGATTIAGTIAVPANASAQWGINFNIATGATVGAITIAAPAQVSFTTNVTITLNTAPTWTGTIGAPILIIGSAGVTGTNVVTIAVPAGTTTLNYVGLSATTFTTGTVNANNSWDFGHNSGVTITAPSGGGGGHIIGG